MENFSLQTAPCIFFHFTNKSSNSSSTSTFAGIPAAPPPLVPCCSFALRHQLDCHPASPSLSWSHSPPLLASHKLATPRRNSPPLVLFSGERPAVGTAFPGHLDAHASRLEPRSHQTDSAWPPSPCARPPECLLHLPPHRSPWRNKFRRRFASISCQTYPWTFSCGHPPLFGLYKAPTDFNSSIHHPPSYILLGELLVTVDLPL